MLAIVGLCSVVLAVLGAPDAAYSALSSVALSSGLAAGAGAIAVGARHYGAKESSSAKGSTDD